MKWDATEGTRGVFSYTNADTMVAWALGNGKQIRGHTLGKSAILTAYRVIVDGLPTVWHSQLPSWVTSGGFDNSTLVSILQNHVTNLVTHFAGKVKTWDVVNEIFNVSSRTTVFCSSF
jgi:endo-1,4-beta-xylanase